MTKYYALHDADTGDYIRPASLEELLRSVEAARYDGGAGIIMCDGVRCYVLGDE